MKLRYISESKRHPQRVASDLPKESDWAALDAMSEGELEAAAKADPDCPPLTEDMLSRLRRRPRRN